MKEQLGTIYYITPRGGNKKNKAMKKWSCFLLFRTKSEAQEKLKHLCKKDSELLCKLYEVLSLCYANRYRHASVLLDFPCQILLSDLVNRLYDVSKQHPKKYLNLSRLKYTKIIDDLSPKEPLYNQTQ